MPAGGNVHFMPNGRSTTTSTPATPVLSTIESWRQPDRGAPWTPAVLDRYRDLAPDCMGRWVVYWRQNMPGLDNTAPSVPTRSCARCASPIRTFSSNPNAASKPRDRRPHVRVVEHWSDGGRWR